MSDASNPLVPELTASTGFAPVLGTDARVLILGSLPSQRSLAAHQYYAHPQNAFWPIMSSLLSLSGDYATRCAQLRQRQVALWDVLRESVRPGSMDADIRLDTARANDFAALVSACPELRLIAFNGKAAETLFRRLVLPGLATDNITLVSLPSTSPAYAAMPFAEKRELWYQRLAGAIPLTRPETEIE